MPPALRVCPFLLFFPGFLCSPLSISVCEKAAPWWPKCHTDALCIRSASSTACRVLIQPEQRGTGQSPRLSTLNEAEVSIYVLTEILVHDSVKGQELKEIKTLVV